MSLITLAAIMPIIVDVWKDTSESMVQISAFQTAPVHQDFMRSQLSKNCFLGFRTLIFYHQEASKLRNGDGTQF